MLQGRLTPVAGMSRSGIAGRAASTRGRYLPLASRVRCAAGGTVDGSMEQCVTTGAEKFRVADLRRPRSRIAELTRRSSQRQTGIRVDGRSAPSTLFLAQVCECGRVGDGFPCEVLRPHMGIPYPIPISSVIFWGWFEGRSPSVRRLRRWPEGRERRRERTRAGVKGKPLARQA